MAGCGGGLGGVDGAGLIAGVDGVEVGDAGLEEAVGAGKDDRGAAPKGGREGFAEEGPGIPEGIGRGLMELAPG